MTRITQTPLYPYARSPDQDAAQPPRHPVVIIGAGPVGLAAAIDLGQQGVPVVLLDDNDRPSHGSRAICFSKRTLEIADRLGLGDRLVDMGVRWNIGKVFVGDRQIYTFDLLPEAGHRRPAFINLQQYHLEHALVDRLRALQDAGAQVDLRGGNRLTRIEGHPDHTTLSIDTPDGPYRIEADWLIACDGAGSACRDMLGLGFTGQTFEDNFLIADVTMRADIPTERWFWFDPPFNPGQSALLHKQPDGIWRIDLQLGRDIDREAEMRPENVMPRITAMLGPDVAFSLEWVSIYRFQCRRMSRFRHGRVIFAGDAAHQVSPFGARGANSGLQDADNLCWKLRLVLAGDAPETLLDSYDTERVQAADENILHSTRATEFITPKSAISRTFRDAVLDLATRHAFARQMVNSGRLSQPCIHDGSPLNTPDALTGPARSRPGAVCPDAPLGDGYLLDRLGHGFTLLALGSDAPRLEGVNMLEMSDALTPELRARFLGDAAHALYLIRPDQHVAARWPRADAATVRQAISRATGHTS